MLSQVRVQHGLLGPEPSITYRDAAAGTLQNPVTIIIMAEGCLATHIADEWLIACERLHGPGGLDIYLEGSAPPPYWVQYSL